MRASNWTPAIWLLTLGLAGCSATKGDLNDSGGGDEADADTDADADADSDADTDEGSADFSGTVVFEDGSPVPGALVNMCHSVCISTNTDSSGVFSYSDLPATTFAFDVAYDHDGTHAVPLSIFTLQDEEDRTLSSNLVVPAYATSEVLGNAPASVVVDGGLMVMTVPADFSTPVGVDDPPYLSGVQMDPSTTALPLDNVSGTVVGMWYLGMWNANADPGWGFTLSDDLGVAAGSTLQIWVGDYLAVAWRDAGTATVNANGTITSDANSGISNFSTLLLVAE